MIFSRTMSTPESLFPSPPVLERSTSRAKPYVKIIEQPFKSLRYRYLCEGRPGSIPGASSTAENKTPFAIQIVGYQGRVVILVSCVTKDHPHRPHPHNLVGLHCRNGVCTFEADVTSENPVITFSKLAVQCVKKRDVKEALRVREAKNVDPFLTGFGHSSDIKSIDLNVMRLCFQVFLKNENRPRVVLTPVVSDPIKNKKTLPDPQIHRLSHCNSYVNGRTEDIILLCTKVIKEDIEIQIFETKNNQVVWKDKGTFHPNHVYNSTAICFRPPMYHNQDITEPVKVFLQLVRPSDGFKSRSVDFEYLPLDAVPNALKEKRKKCQDRDAFFAQLLDTASTRKNGFFSPSLETQQLYQPTEQTRTLLTEADAWILPQAAPLWPQQTEVPVPVNNINQNGPSTSRRSTQGELPNWNIHSDDFSIGTNVNLDSASGVLEVLDIDYNQMELEPIHISSGDLEMTEDVNRLSGSLKEYLVM